MRQAPSLLATCPHARAIGAPSARRSARLVVVTLAFTWSPSTFTLTLTLTLTWFVILEALCDRFVLQRDRLCHALERLER